MGPHLPQNGKGRQAVSSPQWGATAKRTTRIIPGMGNNLKSLRDARGWTIDDAAREWGMSYGGYLKLERGERRLTNDYIAKASEVYAVSEADVISDPATVPLIGHVGAGGQAEFSSGQGPFGMVDAPPRYTTKTVAVEVRGDSMPNVAEHGWLLYYDNVQRPIEDSLVGAKSPAVVGLADGRVLVKRVVAGSQPGLYHLLSTGSDAPIVDARILWAAKVTWIKPRWD
jgi:transcriptional regulator with XRE-family HTH domain